MRIPEIIFSPFGLSATTGNSAVSGSSLSTAAPQTNVPSRKNVVILGGGFGGIAATRALAKSNVDITLIDRRNHHLFQPLLYQVATAGLSPADIAAPIRSLVGDQENVTVLMDAAKKIRAEDNVVELDAKELKYDYLIVATGSEKHYFGNDAWAAHAPGLKNLEDAVAIRRKILTAFEKAEAESDPETRRELMHFVVVGGGPTGVEMAGAIAELAKRALVNDFKNINPEDARITLIQGADRLLNFLPEDLAESARTALAGLGVEVMLKTSVKNISATEVSLQDGRVLKTRNTFWTAGVKPSPLLQDLPTMFDKGGRVLIDPHCRAPGLDNVFVVGDAAVMTQNGKVINGLAPIAAQQGDYAGRAIANLVNGNPLPEAFHYFDKGTLSVIGRHYAVAEIGKIKSRGFTTWLTWWLVHIFYLANFRNRASVFLQWAWSYLTFKKGARLILNNETDNKTP